MPQNKFALARYCVIDNLLRKHGHVKTVFIVDVCRKNLNCSITQRTIQMDIEAMKNDSFLGYYAPIEYCNQKKAYYYRDADFRLFPYQFSNEEISLMEELLIFLHNFVLDDKYKLLIKIVDKIKMFNN